MEILSRLVPFVGRVLLADFPHFHFPLRSPPRQTQSKMPTLMAINDTPPKADFITPQEAKKYSASDEGIPLLSSEESESNDERQSNSKLEKKVDAKSTKDASGADSKGKSRKRGGRQITIFESIGVPRLIITPKTSTGETNADKSAKKKLKRTVITPKDNAFPVCIHITAEGKEPKKVMITCHGIRKNDFSDAFSSPIVLKEKRALPKDPVARFLVGFGRYIW